jgi:hypothetical protein
MMNTGGICSKIIAVTRERGRGRTSDRMRTLYGDRWPRGEKGKGGRRQVAARRKGNGGRRQAAARRKGKTARKTVLKSIR